MEPTPLTEIGFLSWRDHKSALRWLGRLYTDPESLRTGAEGTSRKGVLDLYLKLWWHCLPYVILLSVLGRLFLQGIIGLEHYGPTAVLPQALYLLQDIAIGIALGIVGGISTGIALGFAAGFAAGTTLGIAVVVIGVSVSGITVGTNVGIAGGILLASALGIATGIAVGSALGITVGIAARGALGIALGIVAGMAAGMGAGSAAGSATGIAAGFALGIASAVSLLRAYYAPASILYAWLTPLAKWYSYHPAAWDKMIALPMPGLDRVLVRYSQYQPEQAAAEIERLISEYPAQRGKALRAKTVLLAREAAGQADLSVLSRLTEQLPEGKKGFLADTGRIRELVDEIERLQIRINTIERPVLCEPYLQALCTSIENFSHKIGGFHEPLVSEFRKASENWLSIAQDQLDKARSVTAKRPTPQVFRAGDPVDRNNEAFVPRTSVVSRLEKQILLSTGCPGVILYGRRRIGKSTILRNLEGFLPPSVVIVDVSMQDPQAFVSLPFWIEKVTSSLREAMADEVSIDKVPDDLPGFFNILSTYNEFLDKNDKRLILAFDEYENIDRKIAEGVFPEDLLSTIRESIQSHRSITWLFCGAREIQELTHAPWTSYLVSARTIEVPPFTEDETRLLLTEPLRHSALWDKESPDRPRFNAAFWGDRGVERIHAEAGAWPHLVQLIAETLVDLINDERTQQVTPELMTRALDIAVVNGHNVLYELVYRECTAPDEWEYLRGFCAHSSQPPPTDNRIRASLQRRLLIAEQEDQWRLRVPLMKRWLEQRSHTISDT